MTDTKQEGRPSPGFRCWFCDHRFQPRQVLRDGILRSRRPGLGGPYRLFLCGACNQDNLCEKTRGGRWFASPHCKVGFLDYLFSPFLDTSTSSAETLLAAISWFRENEERRRYYFELDGDTRYSHGNWLRRLWPTAKPTPASGGQRSRRSAPPREEAQGDRLPPGRPPSPAIVTPYEILGVSHQARPEEIREAFRRMALHYHPDKVVHLGPEFERVAHEKFLRLKEAYEHLMARQREREQRGS